jgi:hypothetical protein
MHTKIVGSIHRRGTEVEEKVKMEIEKCSDHTDWGSEGD